MSVVLRNIAPKLSLLSLLLFAFVACAQPTEKSTEMKAEEKNISDYKSLTEDEAYVILRKGTEPPFTGRYTDFKEEGVYTCKQCGEPLYHSSSKFDSHCGWPSFDDEIPNAVTRIPDKDGRRTEIVCSNCGGHLGHVFLGEGYTDKNTRHCVNSISLEFKAEIPHRYDTVYFASGCFWGTEYMFTDLDGVISTRVGYIGGHTQAPTYKMVCTGNTGHAEATEVVYDPAKISYETLAKRFFETHDPTQIDRQGPDIGTQYRTEIFYTNDDQKQISKQLVDTLLKKGYSVVTQLTKAEKFWEAEAYHQKYYERKGSKPYCHFEQPKF